MTEEMRDWLEVARDRKAAAFKVFICCDDPSHPHTVAVTNFIALPDGGWHEEPASRAPISGYGSTGRTIVDDTLPESGWANQPSENHQEIRNTYELACRKCSSRGVTFSAREENLFPALDYWRTVGESRVTLVMVRARL